MGGPGSSLTTSPPRPPLCSQPARAIRCQRGRRNSVVIKGLMLTQSVACRFVARRIVSPHPYVLRTPEDMAHAASIPQTLTRSLVSWFVIGEWPRSYLGSVLRGARSEAKRHGNSVRSTVGFWSHGTNVRTEQHVRVHLCKTSSQRGTDGGAGPSLSCLRSVGAL